LKSKNSKLQSQQKEENEKFKASEKIYLSAIEDYKKELGERVKIIKQLIQENEAILLEKESFDKGKEYFESSKEKYNKAVDEWEEIQNQFSDKEVNKL